MAAAKAADQDAVGSLKYKTLVFKVLIHCEGCKKKVKKVLQSIDGVYETTIDSQLHKVTVTCSVEAETVIKKLSKSGKHVELWPENSEKKDKKPAKQNSNEKQKNGGESSADGGPKNNSSAEKVKPASAKNGGGGTGGDDGSKFEVQSPAGDQMGSKVEEPATVESGGGKKKKKKGQKANTGPNGDASASAADVPSGQAVPELQVPPMASSMNVSLPHQPIYPYAPIFYGPPLFGVSYNTANPSSTSSYYTPTAIAMHDNAYGPPPPPSDPIEKFNENDSHDYGDDESSCSIM